MLLDDDDDDGNDDEKKMAAIRTSLFLVSPESSFLSVPKSKTLTD